MPRYRLVTTPVRYKVTGSEMDAPTDPGNELAVAALHEDIARKCDVKVSNTIIQHRDFRTGSWIDHTAGGAS